MAFKENAEECILSMAEHKDLYDAIIKDDVQEVYYILDSYSTLKKRVLSGKFDISLKSGNRNGSEPDITNVWHLVATLCSQDMVLFWLKEGVDIFAKDGLKYNVLHSMILASALEPEMEDQHIKNYKVLTQNITTEEKRALLMEENNDKMRPLEFAMHMATTGLFQGEKINVLCGHSPTKGIDLFLTCPFPVQINLSKKCLKPDTCIPITTFVCSDIFSDI